MARNARWIVLGLVILTAGLAALAYGYNALGGFGAAAGLDPTDRDKVALGATIYAANCASCHGADLQGQPDWRRRRADGRLPAPPHDADGHTWHHPGAQLFELTKFGPAALAGGAAPGPREGDGCLCCCCHCTRRPKYAFMLRSP